METPTVEIPASLEAVYLQMEEDSDVAEANAPLDVAFSVGGEDDMNGDGEEQPNVFIE